MNHCIFPSRLSAPRKMAFAEAYLTFPPNIDGAESAVYWKNVSKQCFISRWRPRTCVLARYMTIFDQINHLIS